MKKILAHALLALCLAGVVYAFGPGLYRLCTNRDSLDAFLRAAGILAPAGFVLLAAVQVIVAPIPAVGLGLVGGYFFGFGVGSILNVLGLFIGSMAAFGLVRLFGKPLVDRLLGKGYAPWLKRVQSPRGMIAIAIVFLLPFLPDDAICFLAALTPMRPAIFAFLVLTCRTPGVLVASLVGSGIIALPWYAWAGVAVLVAAILYVLWRKQDQLVGWTDRLAKSEQ